MIVQTHRDLITTALASSFDTMSNYLGYFPRPTYDYFSTGGT